MVRALHDHPQAIIVRNARTRSLPAAAELRPEVARLVIKVMGLDKQLKSLVTR